MAETIYTQLNEQGVPIRSIVITKKMLETGRWGDPKNWVRGVLPIPDPKLDVTGDVTSPENKVMVDGKL